MPVYCFRVTPDVTEQDVLVEFSDDDEARQQAMRVLTGLIDRCSAGGLMQRIDVFREDGSILLSVPSRH